MTNLSLNLSNSKEVCFNTAKELASWKINNFNYTPLLIINAVLAILIAYSPRLNALIKAPITIELGAKEITLIKDTRLLVAGIIFYINIATVITNKLIIKCI